MQKLKLIICLSLLVFTSSFSYCQNYILYGLAPVGGGGKIAGPGTLFGYNIGTGQLKVYHVFGHGTGTGPVSSLILANNGLLYGTTEGGGSSGDGVLFSFNCSTDSVTPLINFNGTNGSEPWGKPIQASNGKLYGMTQTGGNDMDGFIYRYDIGTSQDSNVFNFDNFMNGSEDLTGNLIQDTTVGGGELLYGLTEQGDINDGTFFSYNPVTGLVSIIDTFNFPGIGLPEGSLMQASNGLLYSTCQSGGTFNGGLFSYNTHTKVLTTLLDFNDTIAEPWMGVMLEGKNGLLYWLASFVGAHSAGSICCYNPNTNTASLVYSFDTIHGRTPWGSLILDTINGLMYGMTSYGGKYNGGVLFSFDPSTAIETDLVDLDSVTGYNPYGDLLLLPENPEAIKNIQTQNFELTVFPNPFTNTTTIAVNTDGQYYLELDDITGRKIKCVEFTGTQYELSADGLAKGMYFIRVFNNENNVVGTSKVVVQ